MVTSLPGLAILAETLAQFASVTRGRAGLDRAAAIHDARSPADFAPGRQRFLFRQWHAHRLRASGGDRIARIPAGLVVSGINNGSNMGEDTIYSGTVAAATEGYLLGIPSLAISLTGKRGEHYRTAAGCCRTGAASPA